jgi:hypothetical protein
VHCDQHYFTRNATATPVFAALDDSQWPLGPSVRIHRGFRDAMMPFSQISGVLKVAHFSL